VADVVTQTRERTDRGTGSGLGTPWNVTVLNDSHNTFDGVAGALAAVLPDISFEQGMAYANQIHSSGRAVVWAGHREVAEHYWNGLSRRGLTMAPLNQ
jgi:ATP-dependent Clp protease adaptor protein ClpS